MAPDGTVTPAPTVGVDWSGCDLSGANLVNASLAGANLTNAALTDATLTGATLSGATLTNTNLTNSDLTDANFVDASLSSVNMDQANVSGTDFTNATLTKLSYDGVSANDKGTPARVPAPWTFVDGFLVGPTVNLQDNVQLQNADLHGVDLAGATIGGTFFNDANLDGADLAGANIADTNLPGATLDGADLTGASIVHSDLTDANLDDANLTNADLYEDTVTGLSVVGATWSNTECPDGTNSDQHVDGCTTKLVVVGAWYSAVGPYRVMDTRSGTGVGKAGAVGAGGTLTLSLPSIAGESSANLTAVVLNVTVTQPQKTGYLTVYPGTSTRPTASNLDFTAGQTLANLVTVPVSGGKVSFYNGSGGTVQVIADVAGYYGPGQAGFQPQSPARVLDTRNGTGAAKGALAAGTRIRLNLSGKVPSDTTAVVLNVTVTGPQKAGYLSVYPDSVGKPTTSSLDFTSGQTVANQVIVPLNNGIADFYNGSPGTVQVIADLAGYYAPSATDLFVSYGPYRILDTRTSKALGAFATLSYSPASISDCVPHCPAPVAVVANVTVTQPAKAGYLTVYPEGASRPVASSLDFSAGQTIPNLVTAAVGGNAVNVYNGSPGNVQLIVDEEGYFIASP